MEPVLSHHVHKLIDDSEKAKNILEMLEKDRALWVRDREEEDLASFIMRIKKLQYDISIILGDCFFTGAHQDESRALQEDLHLAFARLNDLFQDIKKARLDLKEAYIDPGELKQLEIDWGRFRKTIGQTLKHLQDGMNSREVTAGSQ